MFDSVVEAGIDSSFEMQIGCINGIRVRHPPWQDKVQMVSIRQETVNRAIRAPQEAVGLLHFKRGTALRAVKFNVQGHLL